MSSKMIAKCCVVVFILFCSMLQSRGVYAEQETIGSTHFAAERVLETAWKAPVSAVIAWPHTGKIVFQVTKGGTGFERNLDMGRSIHAWYRDEESYNLRAETETTGLGAILHPVRFVQISEGNISGVGLIPRQYRVERNEDVTEKIQFSWKENRVTFSSGQTEQEEVLKSGSQDILSYYYQLGLFGFWKGQRELMIGTGKKYECYVFVAKEESLRIPGLGKIDTLHIRTQESPDEHITELWLAPAYHHLPVRIRYIDRKGEAYSQQAVEMVIDGVKIFGKTQAVQNKISH